MAASAPYLGSRISLISNANMRYEGTLFTIDPVEATVALHNGIIILTLPPCLNCLLLLQPLVFVLC